MNEYLLVVLDKLVVMGFLDTRASLSINIIVLFLAILPILSGVSIFFAIRKHIKLHQVSQFLLFFLTLISLIFFAYTVYYNKGFEVLLQESSIDFSIALALLVSHLIISLSTLTLWMFSLIYALSDRKRRALPGLYSLSHVQSGKRVFKGILLISLSSVGIYWMLFMA